MPRPLRLEFNDAWYHVMNRGAGRRNIYKNSKHRMIFLNLLGEGSKLFNIEIHAYCLMNNHYHLLIKTPRGNLSRAMRHINGVFTQRYNRQMKSDGPLFRGRYKAIVVDKDSYLLQVSRYIHLNPVAAKMTKKPSCYKWSSYFQYLHQEKTRSWLHTEEILSMIGKRRHLYQQFVERGIDNETENFYARGNLPVIFGSSVFRKKLLSSLHKNKIDASKTDYRLSRELPQSNKIEGACVAYFGIKESSLYKKARGQKNDAKKIAIYGCRSWACEKLSAIAARYSCGHSNVSNIVREIDKRLTADEQLKMILKKVQKLVFTG